MPLRLRPNDPTFYDLFTESANHLVEGSRILAELLGSTAGTGLSASHQIAAQMKAYDFRKVVDNSTIERLVKEKYFETLFGASIKAEQDRKAKLAFK